MRQNLKDLYNIYYGSDRSTPLVVHREVPGLGTNLTELWHHNGEMISKTLEAMLGCEITPENIANDPSTFKGLLHNKLQDTDGYGYVEEMTRQLEEVTTNIELIYPDRDATYLKKILNIRADLLADLHESMDIGQDPDNADLKQYLQLVSIDSFLGSEAPRMMDDILHRDRVLENMVNVMVDIKLISEEHKLQHTPEEVIIGMEPNIGDILLEIELMAIIRSNKKEIAVPARTAWLKLVPWYKSLWYRVSHPLSILWGY